MMHKHTDTRVTENRGEGLVHGAAAPASDADRERNKLLRHAVVMFYPDLGQDSIIWHIMWVGKPRSSMRNEDNIEWL